MPAKLALRWQPCQAPGVIRSVLGLVGPVSVYCDWVRWKLWSATSISVWQHVKLSEQIRPWDTLACCWDVKQPTNNNSVTSILDCYDTDICEWLCILVSVTRMLDCYDTDICEWLCILVNVTRMLDCYDTDVCKWLCILVSIIYFDNQIWGKRKTNKQTSKQNNKQANK